MEEILKPLDQKLLFIFSHLSGNHPIIRLKNPVEIGDFELHLIYVYIIDLIVNLLQAILLQVTVGFSLILLLSGSFG